jgi:hypothetical protein
MSRRCGASVSAPSWTNSLWLKSDSAAAAVRARCPRSRERAPGERTQSLTRRRRCRPALYPGRPPARRGTGSSIPFPSARQSGSVRDDVAEGEPGPPPAHCVRSARPVRCVDTERCRGARERDRVAHLGEAGDIGEGAREAEAEARVRHRAIAAQVAVPGSAPGRCRARPCACRVRRAAPRVGRR